MPKLVVRRCSGPACLPLLAELWELCRETDRRVAGYDAKLHQIAIKEACCRRLMTIPGVGALSATALVAAVGDAGVFDNGRQMAAWMGLTPKEHSTGGKTRLLGISKRGNRYLRTLLIHGARSLLHWLDKKKDRRSLWATGLLQELSSNLVYEHSLIRRLSCWPRLQGHALH
jgi:transposase